MKLVFENKKRMNEELWDSSRVLDLTRYFLDKYPYADDDQIMKAIKKQMTKEGSTLPSSDSEFRRAYFSARDEYDEDDMYDESLSKKRMNENLSSDDVEKFFKDFLVKNYSNYKNDHKNDRRFLSTLKSDLEQIIDKAITDFWFE